MAFRVASYWDLEGTFDAGAKHDQRMFPAKLHSVDGARVARGSDFGPDGAAQGHDRAQGRAPRPDPRRGARRRRCSDTTYDVRSVESKPYRRSPYAPFRTTTLQQEASRKLGFSASVDDVGRAAALRERLHHLHAYRLHDAVGRRGRRGPGPGARAVRRGVPPRRARAPTPRRSRTPRRRTRRSAPPATRFRTPAQTGLTGDQFRLYELIWMRTVASQMKDAVGQSVTIRLGGAAADRRGRRLLRQRPRDHLPRLPQGLRRGHRRRRRGHGRRRDPAARPAARATPVSRRLGQRRRATRPSRRPATPRPR